MMPSMLQCHGLIVRIFLKGPYLANLSSIHHLQRRQDCRVRRAPPLGKLFIIQFFCTYEYY